MTKQMKNSIENKSLRENGTPRIFFAGGGEMGELIRLKDWSQTALGPPESWPQSLRSALGICLGSAFPIGIYWGNELTLLYNDAWSPIPGSKHPWALGKPAVEVWPEIWNDIEPLFKKVFLTGEASRSIDALLPMQRHGYTEECYFDFTFTPVRGEDGEVAGIFNAVIETTYRVINERRANILRDLSEKLNYAKSVPEIFEIVKPILEKSVKDIPFSLFYLNSNDGKRSDLVLEAGSKTSAPSLIDLAQTYNIKWPFAEIINNGLPFQIKENSSLFGAEVIKSDWPEPTKETLIMPIGLNKVIGFFVAGINPRRALDMDYRNFLQSIGSHFSTTIYNVQSYEEERKKAEALAEIDRAKTLFFSNVSHEFRTPLTLMLGPVRDLLDETLDNNYRQQLEVVHRNGLRLQKLVNTLLDFSRFEAGRIQVNYTATDLAVYTAELASNFRSAIEKAGMQLIVKTSALSEDIYVDREMWEKIVLNLLSNAFKFTFSGEIEVSITEDDDNAMLVVKDTGEGIPAADLPYIFDRFKRVEGARSRTFEGSGIGLSLVQDLVKQHGGSIHVESELGKGTTFSIIIPKGADHLPKEHIQSNTSIHSTAIDTMAYVEEAEQWLEMKETDFLTGDNKAGTEDSSSTRPRIVLADDNADMRDYIRRLLSGRFHVIPTSNGRQALDEIHRELPDLILTDVMMPEMDGLALLESLKADPKTAFIPVIILSARAGEEAKLEGIEAGADDYLLKPFNANELIARVSTLIAANHSKRETEHRLYELFMQAPAIVALLRGPDHVYELANLFYRKVIGEHRNIIGKPVKEAIPELAAQGFIDILDKVYQTGEPFFGNEMLTKIDKDGTGKLEDTYFDFVYQPVKHNDVVNGILIHAVDVTSKVIAQQQAKEREIKLYTRTQQQKVVSELGVLALSDTDLRKLMNVAVQKLKEVLNVEYTKVLELLPGGKEVVLRAGVGWNKDIIIGESTVDTGKNSQAGFTLMNEEPVIVKDLRSETRFNGPALLTDHHVVSGMSCVILGKNNQPYGVLGIHTVHLRDFTKDDISFLQSVANILATAIQRKQDEESLRQSNDKVKESEEKLRALADNIPNLCWMANADGWIYWYNSRWYEYTGTTPESMKGWGWQSVHDPAVLPNVLDRWKNSIATGKLFEMVFPLKGADGIYRSFLTRIVPVRDDKGNIWQWFGTNTDITERENLAKQKDEFMGIASHELKTPVTSIKASIQIVSRLYAERSFGKAANFLAKADMHIDKLTALINDLLDVSKIQAGKLQYNFSVFSVDEFLEDAVEQIAQQAKKHRITVKGDTSVKVCGDKVRLEQVVTNLLTNAIKYSPGANEVIIDITIEDEFLKISVTDFGIGIPGEMLPYVFDRFFRVEKTSNQFQGLGLGLYICSEIIRRHGGKISLVSTEGKGSTFWFIIPLKISDRVLEPGEELNKI